MDADGGGEIDLDEFHDFFGFMRTKFSDRVFGVLDLDNSGELNFAELTIGLWNYWFVVW